MKKAKVSKGLVHHVWPWVKTLPDGRQVTKELPAAYRGLNGKPVPDCIVDVPDDVQPGWVYVDGKYAPRVKVYPQPGHSDLIEVLAAKLGIPYKELMDEVMLKKKARHAAAKTNK